MGLLDIFKSKKKRSQNIIKKYYYNEFSNFIYQYASTIYQIPEVRTAIESYADIFSKIPKYHKRLYNGESNFLNGNLNRVLDMKPNPFQNATQFWKEVVTNLMLENNVFIEPIFDNKTGNLKELYVLPTKSFNFKMDGDRAYVVFNDQMGGKTTHNLDDLIYINRFSSLSGGAKTDLGLYETVVQALMDQALSIASPNKIKAFLKGERNATSNLKPKDKTGVMEDLKVNMAAGVNGIAYMDSPYEIKPIPFDEEVNEKLMKMVVNTVYNYFGISDSIVNGTASEIEYSLFLSNKIEPLAKQIEQELTAKLFTQREIEFGNRVEFDTFRLHVSTLRDKTQLFSVASRQGVMNLDEMRSLIGLPQLPDGLGKMYRVTADTINLEKVDEYQAAQKGVDAMTIAKNNLGKGVENNEKESDI